MQPSAEACNAYGQIRVNKVQVTARRLGRAGLVPFVAAPALLAMLPASRVLICELLADYALGIIAFLLGIWWGMGLIRRSARALVMSNAIFLAALLGRLLDDAPFFVLAAAILVLTLAVERSHALFRRQPPYYARLRLELTAVASIALLLSAALAAQVN